MGQNICGAMNSQNPQQISSIQDISELDFNRNSTYRKLEQYSNVLCKERDISIQHNLMIQKILSMGQYELFDHINQISTQEKKNEYLRYLESIGYEMEVIDSLYHHFMKQSGQSSFDPEDDFNVDVITHLKNKLISEEIPYEDYERLYSTGLKLIKQKQVALVIMAGGKNLRFDSDIVKCTQNVGLPSGSGIMELIGRKLWTLKEIAFSNSPNSQQASFQIYVVVNYQNGLQIKGIWQKNNFFGFEESDVTFVSQSQYPITDNNGKLILKSETQCHLFPSGSGDVLRQLIQLKHTNKLIEKGYKYLHFIGVDNLLVKPLDPLFIGIASENKKAINQKIVQISPDESEFYRIANINGRASLLEFDSIRKLLKQRLVGNSNQIPKDLDDAPAFMFNTLVSLNFLVEFSQRAELKQTFESKFRVMRRHLKSLNFQTFGDSNTTTTGNTQGPEDNNIIVFEKLIGDILELTDDIGFLQVHKAEEHAPIIYKQGKYSPQEAVTSLSNLHKRWLGLEQNEVAETDLIEVCPQISYAGEGLDNCAEFLKQNRRSQQFPLFINQQKIKQFEALAAHDLQNGMNRSINAGDDKRGDNHSLYHSIDGHIHNNNGGVDQSFNQRKENDLIYKSFSNLVSGSQRQIPISSKNIQRQVILDENYQHQNQQQQQLLYNPANGNGNYIQNNNAIILNQNGQREVQQSKTEIMQNENRAVVPTNQVVFTHNKVNSMTEIDLKSSSNTRNTQDA